MIRNQSSSAFNHLQRRTLFPLLMAVLFCFFLLFLYFFSDGPVATAATVSDIYNYNHRNSSRSSNIYSSATLSYPFVAITDLDTDSRQTLANGKFRWVSHLRHGTLTRYSSGEYGITWGKNETVYGVFNEDGRGLELSDLRMFGGRLYTCDDRTGLVYEVEDGKLIPTWIVMEGNGRNSKGFKCEWLATKDDKLYVGSIGKEWVNKEGEISGHANEWIKIIDLEGRIKHVDWTSIYTNLRKASGFSYPGYLLHEAVNFNPEDRRWYFLPRRASDTRYDEVLDEERASNYIISTDEDFSDIEVSRIGELSTRRGFSSFTFIPGRGAEILAVKSEEVGNVRASYVMVYDINEGTTLMKEEFFGDMKFEGIEIL